MLDLNALTKPFLKVAWAYPNKSPMIHWDSPKQD